MKPDDFVMETAERYEGYLRERGCTEEQALAVAAGSATTDMAGSEKERE
jgi:hypothetical protein